LVACTQGEAHLYDCNGNAITKLSLFCMEGSAGNVNIIGVDWYDGLEGYSDPNAPTLALGLDNGRVQLMRGESQV
jgi:WD repeat-containing protein 35